MDLGQRYLRSKRVRDHRQEDAVLGNVDPCNIGPLFSKCAKSRKIMFAKSTKRYIENLMSELLLRALLKCTDPDKFPHVSLCKCF